jgi:Uma2 family endonuclease
MGDIGRDWEGEGKMTTPTSVKQVPPPAVDANGSKSILDRMRVFLDDPVLQRLRPKGMPWACEDEETSMGDSTVHTLTTSILLYSLAFHFAARPGFRIFANLNLHFSQEHPNLFLAPDIMLVRPPQPLPEHLSSYRIGEQGPTPLLVGEVLSPRTFQEGDLDRKAIQYREMGVDEYIVADVTGDLLPQRLQILDRQEDGSWREGQDADGGITSRLGFRVIIEADGQLRVIDAATGKRYARPDEAQKAVDELAVALERNRALEEELARLRGGSAKDKKGKGRRRKS